MGRRTKPKLFVPDQSSDSESSDSETPIPTALQSTFIRQTNDRYRERRNLVFKDSSPDFDEENALELEDELEELNVAESSLPTQSADDAAVDPIDGDEGFEHEGDAVPDDAEHHICEPETETPNEDMERWLRLRDIFLNELMRLEGLPAEDGEERCQMCGIDDEMLYRCEPTTALRFHDSEFLTLVQQRWTGNYFWPASLAALGLSVQLNHIKGSCPLPKPGPSNFVVMDVNGFHFVNLQYCGCHLAVPEVEQILRYGWYPGTTTTPHTAISMSCLVHFHLLTLQSKITAYDYYQTVSRLTDNSGIFKSVDRYKLFLRVVRQWRHLKLLKRAGRANDPGGIEATEPGGLAVLCPACPNPDWNMVEAELTEGLPLDLDFNLPIYSIDANFRLKRKYISSILADPGLGTGWAYFVDDRSYKAYVKQHENDADQDATCSNHHAQIDAEKGSKGYDTNGIAAVICSRHQFFLPTAVGDLAKGEKYLKERVKDLPFDVKIDLTQFPFVFLVPKFHLPAHVRACQLEYSFNLQPGVGRTDGEGIERDWSGLNSLATSIREMGPGSRHDTLDDHFGDWNFRRTVALPEELRSKLIAATEARNKHSKELQSFTESLPKEAVDEWESQVANWEKDRNNVNPYEMQSDLQEVTQADVRKRLLEAEGSDLQTQSETLEEHDHAVENTSATEFIVGGLAIEVAQAQLREEAALLKDPTTQQVATLQRKRNNLQRKIIAWRQIQVVYMPFTTGLLPQVESVDVAKPEDTKLLLPSQVPPRLREACLGNVADKEWQLRLGQLGDSLAQVRRSLCVRTHLMKYKQKNVRGQRPNTRHNALIDSNNNRTHRYAATYNRAHQAMISLDPLRDDWQKDYPPLSESDLIPLYIGIYSDDDPRTSRKSQRDRRTQMSKVSEGNRTIPWIWRSHKVFEEIEEDLISSGHLNEGLRIEWCRSRARFRRWDEEVLRLIVEMTRTVRFFERRASWWREKAAGKDVDDAILSSGLRAYPQRQAAILDRMAERCKPLWAFAQSIPQKLWPQTSENV
ncbi:hypothetical protein NLI96_g10890 [Meripilus lineatus]|uniref:CxC2-like cysteine cluster KDZ transposase-associated domain-containing protein n=1 Tax=Meripilus lineatus TaxID=2056292 RepID=A0AAD5UST4_9APHY|nr:hypothetical protein NLI96_g10890 [Physisporinus lineatus]